MSNESELKSAKVETELSQVKEVGDLSSLLEKFWEITLDILNEITEKVVTRQGEHGRDETRKEEQGYEYCKQSKWSFPGKYITLI